jgi:agmatinase
MGEIFYPPSNFFALPAERSQYDSSRAVVLPVPYDSTTSARAGARDGPTAIILASQDLETFDLELGYDVSLHGIHTLPEVAPHTGSPEAMVDRIAASFQTC